MPITTSIPTKLKRSQIAHGGPQLDFTDFAVGTFSMLLCVAGSGAPSVTSTGVQYVADVTGTNAEVTGTGYARQVLTGVSVAYDGSVNTQVNWTWANVTFAQNAAGFTTARYAIIYCTQVGSADASWPVVAVIDLGATQSVTTAALVIEAPATGGLIEWA
jgi:hypothetical protein